MNDLFFTLKWFLSLFIIGVAFLPLTAYIFENFKDKGYIFSKIIGLAFVSYLVFILGILKLIKFSQAEVVFVILFFFVLNYLFLRYKKIHFLKMLREKIWIFLAEEIIFLLTLSFWAYVRGTMPDIHGLEKFMDFGFLNSILRADYFPPKDMWYTPFSINYYYFGHLTTAVITKMAAIPSFITYNLMLATLFAFTFTASFSLITNVFSREKFYIKSVLAGILSAILVSLGGNLTTLYAFFKAYVPADSPVPFWQLPFLPFSFPNNYWYPNATRFIYHTIHEFPIYSFVVSDLHGHVIDIPFVLLTIAVSFSVFVKKEIQIYHYVLFGFLLAIMYMTNVWDGLIYFLLIFLLIFFSLFYSGPKKTAPILSLYKFLKSLLIIFITFFAFSLPFNFFFKPFASGIGILCSPKFLTNIGKLGPLIFEADRCQRSPLWQLLILYGFFYFFVVCFLFYLNRKIRNKFSKNALFVIVLIILSTILILTPEFIYIKDIYPTYYRANTMFKLVYQAFIMLSLCCGYIFIKLASELKNKILLASFIIPSIFLLFLVLIYPIFAVNSYYGDLKTNKGLDGTSYLLPLYPADYELINWINKNIKGQPVILEANGDSYTDYARISANTGLPTVIGWTVHEWLWRGTYDIVAPRISDVQTLYTSGNATAVKNLIKKYKIYYVVVSSLEREKYSSLNEKNFEALGKIIYKNSNAKLYKITF